MKCVTFLGWAWKSVLRWRFNLLAFTSISVTVASPTIGVKLAKWVIDLGLNGYSKKHLRVVRKAIFFNVFGFSAFKVLPSIFMLGLVFLVP